jgi:hypothetical protein
MTDDNSLSAFATKRSAYDISAATYCVARVSYFGANAPEEITLYNLMLDYTIGESGLGK